jgi:hypothetical protein
VYDHESEGAPRIGRETAGGAIGGAIRATGEVIQMARQLTSTEKAEAERKRLRDAKRDAARGVLETSAQDLAEQLVNMPINPTVFKEGSVGYVGVDKLRGSNGDSFQVNVTMTLIGSKGTIDPSGL